MPDRSQVIPRPASRARQAELTIAQQRAIWQVDRNIRSFVLRSVDGSRYQIVGSVLGANLELTIEGAPVLQVTVRDYKRELLRSRVLQRDDSIEGWRPVITVIGGVIWELVAIGKSGENLTLTFEDEIVCLLRRYGLRKGDKRITVARGTVTRAMFVKSLLDEVKERRIPFHCPELKKKQPIGKKSEVESQRERDEDRAPGFGPNPQVTVKRARATREQLSNIDAIIQVGLSMGASFKLIATAIMVATQESNIRALNYGDESGPDSRGIFQQRNSWGPLSVRMDPAGSARLFFQVGLKVDKQRPHLHMVDLGHAIQNNARASDYDPWRQEALRTMEEYGLSEGNLPRGGRFQGAPIDAPYQFTRGQGRLRESSWDAITRLASEVNWRFWVLRGKAYFVAEEDLMRSRPRYKLIENDDAVNEINFDYDSGKDIATASVQVRAKRWQVPPGSTIHINGLGPASGRWLVATFSRSMYSDQATIELRKPAPSLPEPANPEQARDPETGRYLPGGGSSYRGGDARSYVQQQVRAGNIVFAHSNDKEAVGDGTVNGHGGLGGGTVTIDEKVWVGLATIAQAGIKFRVSSMVGSHSQFVRGSNPPRQSRHWTGHAIDIDLINNQAVISSAAKSGTIAVMQAVAGANPDQIICEGNGRRDPEVEKYEMTGGKLAPGFYKRGDHMNHIHIGW